MLADDRPGAPPDNVFWAGDPGEAGRFLHGYQSAWLPASLLQQDRQERSPTRCSRQPGIGACCCTSTRAWRARLPTRWRRRATRRRTRPCSTRSRWRSSARRGPPAYPGVPGHEPDRRGRARQRAAIGAAMAELRKLVPDAGLVRLARATTSSADWQHAFWGELRAAARGEDAVRPGRPVLRAPRRGQRALERRRIHSRWGALSHVSLRGVKRSSTMTPSSRSC